MLAVESWCVSLLKHCCEAVVLNQFNQDGPGIRMESSHMLYSTDFSLWSSVNTCHEWWIPNVTTHLHFYKWAFCWKMSTAWTFIQEHQQCSTPGHSTPNLNPVSSSWQESRRHTCSMLIRWLWLGHAVPGDRNWGHTVVWILLYIITYTKYMLYLVCWRD